MFPQLRFRWLMGFVESLPFALLTERLMKIFQDAISFFLYSNISFLFNFIVIKTFKPGVNCFYFFPLAES